MITLPTPEEAPELYAVPDVPQTDDSEDLRRASAAELQAALAHQQLRENVAAGGVSPLEAHAAIADTRNDAMAAAGTPRAQAILGHVLDHREQVLHGELDQHFESAKQAADLDAIRQRQAQARQDASSATTALALHTNLTTLSNTHDELGALAGADPGEIQAAKFRDASAVHSAQIANHLARGDVAGALAYHRSTEPLLSGADNAGVKAALAGPVAQMESDKRVDAHMGALTRDGSAPFSYADPLHGAGRTPVPGDTGVAIPAEAGTPVYPTGQGVATVHGPDSVSVTHSDGSMTSYQNLADLKVQDGDAVTPDTMLGGVAEAGQGVEAGLDYAVTKDGAPVDPASVAEQASQPAGTHDVQAAVDAIQSHPDPSYTADQRARDVAEAVRRVGLAAADQTASALPAGQSLSADEESPATGDLSMYGDRIIPSPFVSGESETPLPTNVGFDTAPAAADRNQRGMPPVHVDGQGWPADHYRKPGRQRDGSYIAPIGPAVVADPQFKKIARELSKIDRKHPMQRLIGTGECVEATKHFSGISAPTALWRAGPAVSGNGSIPIGTAIATFDRNGRYPLGDHNPKNSGIYMGQGPNGGIYILDQWPPEPKRGFAGRPAGIRLMRYHEPNDQYGRPNVSNSAEAYHVILVP